MIFFYPRDKLWTILAGRVNCPFPTIEEAITDIDEPPEATAEYTAMIARHKQ